MTQPIAPKTSVNEPIRGAHELRYANDFVVTSTEQEVANVPWRNALDVWVWGVGITGTDLVESNWRLYAVSGQVQTLIGRAVISQSPDPNAYIFGARNIVCDRFRITVQGPILLGVADGSVPSKISVTAFGVEPSGPPRVFPTMPPSTTSQPPNSRMAPAAWFGGEYGGGALEVRFNGNTIAANIFSSVSLLVDVSGFSEAASNRYIMFFETFAVPADGSTASVYTIKVPAGGSFSWAPIGGRWFPSGEPPIIPPFSEGCSFAVSSTPFVLTRELVATIFMVARAYQG